MNSRKQTFIKGFSAGYQLYKHEPVLIERLLVKVIAILRLAKEKIGSGN